MTVFCKGHVVDPMQFLDYRTMLNFTRLAKFDLQSQQDLREVWSRYKQGEFDFNSCAGPIANLFQILQSLNWQWISPWSLMDSSNKMWLLPLTLSDKPGFAHAIREALRQREIARASGPQRLGVRLQPRADMQGVETGVKFAETRKLSMYLSDYDKGLLIAIVSGSFSTMERDFRHKTRGVTSPFCPFGACANQQVLETRRHRWWECPAWEHLRPPWFRALRPQLDEFPQCFVQCAIGCCGYNGPALDLVQKVFLDIQLAVNRHQNSLGSASQEGNGDGPPQVPPPAPIVRRRLRGKQPVVQQPDALPCSILLNALLWMQIAYHAAGAAAMCNDTMPPRSDNFGKADATPIVGMFIYVRLRVLLLCGTRLALNIKGWWINWLGNMGIP